jgi:hypothetical protein
VVYGEEGRQSWIRCRALLTSRDSSIIAHHRESPPTSPWTPAVNHYPLCPLLPPMDCSMTGFREHMDLQITSVLQVLVRQF